MNIRTSMHLVAVLAAALAITGCEGTTSSESGDVAFRMWEYYDAPVLSAVSYSSTEGASAPVDPAEVTSLIVMITGVQALPAGETSEEDDTAWVSVPFDEAMELDLRALPGDGEAPIELAAGSVAAGDYRKVRLLVSGGTIRFASPLSLGNAQTFEADTDYDVEIPSGAQTGIKTDVSFSVGDETATIDLFFEPEETLLNVVGTGNGRVILTPVIHTM